MYFVKWVSKDGKEDFFYLDADRPSGKAPVQAIEEAVFLQGLSEQKKWGYSYKVVDGHGNVFFDPKEGTNL